MHGIWYDYRMASHLREEAPAAYKDIRAVLRAQHELVKVTRVLTPLLSYNPSSTVAAARSALARSKMQFSRHF
jgi:hypothetical protein